MFHSYNAGSETDELDDIGDSTGLDSDNKVSPSKGRSKSAKFRSSKLEGPNIVFESRIAELEAQLTQAKIDLKKVQEENNENKRKLASGLVDSTCLDGFKRQIDNLQRDKSSLEAQISKLKLSLEQKDGDLDSRYKRGSDAVEQQLRDERNNLEAEIRRLKDDLNKERNKVRELAGEGARRAIQERSAAEQRYNAHFDELQHDLAAQYDNVSKLQLDLERQRREENDLKRELSMKNSAIEELKMELKNKTSSLQADLAQAHAEKASLEEELASARLAIERHQRQAKHETNRLNSEIQSLRQRLDRADADLVHSRRENLRLTEQISTLEKELNMKNLTPISPEKKKDKELSTMLESMENKHAKTVAELESMIQSQNSLMEKLTGECRLLTDKLDDANRRHKEELATLQRQVDSLGRSMLPTHSTSPSVYQAPPTHASATNRNVPHPQADPRPDYTRDNAPGHPELPGQGVTDVRPDAHGDIGQPRTIRKQESRTSLLSQKEEPPYDSNQHNDPDNVEEKHDYEESANVEQSQAIEDVHDVEYKDDVEKPMEVEQTQEYAATDKNYGEGNYDQYDQNYEQTPVTDENEYQNQGYEQPAYAEGQYENYEQQPQYDGNYPQEYADPNAQYEGQYENYATDGNYQGEQSYDTTQQSEEYLPQNQESQEYVAQNQDVSQEVAPNTRVESKQSVSPVENIPSQS
ncbi:hypothetical protein ABMA28_010571 [Loxostege sticticalis]|uniref:Uncharacterized protein n=1 Tax=Loxostege sticticalis TaxID=481309 RepID=A0ABD0S8N8_LOXSC